MASTATTPPARRKKQTVYGKSSSGNPYSPAGTGFFGDDEPARVPVARIPQRHHAVIPARPAKTVPSAPVPTNSSASKAGALPKFKKPTPHVKDTYDVPSDDEATEMFSQVRLPPKQRIQNRLLQEPSEETEQLAPWEMKTSDKDNAPRGTTTRSSRSKAASKPTVEATKSLQREGIVSGKAVLGRTKQTEEEHMAQDNTMMTAMQRLAARRRQAQVNAAASTIGSDDNVKEPPKRPAVKVNAPQTPQKRRRVTPQPSSPRVDTVHAQSTPVVTTATLITRTAADEDNGDIYDVPSADEARQLPPISDVVKKVQARQRARGAGMLRQLTPQKGLSAPSRLEDMVASEHNSTDPTTPPDRHGRSGTPQNVLRNSGKTTPSTPTSHHSNKSTGFANGTLTPKQTQLWADLLEPAVVPHTGMKRLSLAEDMARQKATRGAPVVLQRSSSHVPVRRTRIVDRLKASAPNSSGEDESDDDDECYDAGNQNKSTTTSVSIAKSTPSDATESQKTDRLSQDENSQDRSTKPAVSGSLITYSQQRSHLADDSLESALMLDMPMETRKRPAATARRGGRPAEAVRSTSYHDEDIDDMPTKGLRTIHELRAGGRNARIMGEIEDLLADIADHTTTVRSRRRGALLDLATKLQDKSFAERFISHGFDNALVNECKTPTDPAANFLVATCLLLLLHNEPPKQTLDLFREALPCLGGLLTEPNDIVKVVKERRSNMSRSAQGDIVALCDKLRGVQGLWAEDAPPVISSRLIALKIMDLVVRKLRESGDKSALISSEVLVQLVPKNGFSGPQADKTKTFEAELVISILEALKTLSVAGTWPDKCIGIVAALPAIFADEWKAAAGTKWLAYRLCANITNESPVVRSAFVDGDAVRHLMAEIVTGLGNLQHLPTTADNADNSSARDFDILVLAIGTLINLTEHNTLAQQQAIHDAALPSLTSIVAAFLEGQKRALEAESVEQSAANVAYGYLAIMLANICQDGEARQMMRNLLPGGKLDVLVAAVEEFVQHHQLVDRVEATGSGSEWSNFTERLLGVLVKLKAGEGEGMDNVRT